MGMFRTAIVGVGPIGGILAAYMRKQGEDIILVDTNREHLDAIGNHGLEITGLQELSVRFDKFCYGIEELSSYDHGLVVICLKTPVMEKVMPGLKKVISDGEKVISFQNGLYTERFLGEEFGSENVFRCVVNYAGNLVGPGKIKMSFFNKPNYLGASTNTNREFGEKYANILNEAGLETKWCEDICREEWIKVILNAALSPISAITGLTMKEAMDNPGTRELVEMSLMEGTKVARAVGYELPPHFFEFGIGYLSRAGYHKPSMRIDIENSMETEIDFLNGKIAQFGEMYGIPTPVNTALTKLVKGMELKNISGTRNND